MDAEHETRDFNELSDAKRALILSEALTVYRQPGGCLEINQRDIGTYPERQDIIHICNLDVWRELIAGMTVVAERVPVRQ